MAYFHPGDDNPSSNFFASPCQYDAVYLADLKTGEYIISDNPYYFQDQNGLMNGINETYTSFKLYNSKNEVVTQLSVHWETECKLESSVVEKPNPEFVKDHTPSLNYLGILSLVCIFGMIFYLIYRKGKS